RGQRLVGGDLARAPHRELAAERIPRQRRSIVQWHEVRVPGRAITVVSGAAAAGERHELRHDTSIPADNDFHRTSAECKWECAEAAAAMLEVNGKIALSITVAGSGQCP